MDNKDVSARERIVALDRFTVAEIARLDQQHAAQVHAVQLVRESDRISRASFETNVSERFASVNEFRRALDDLGKSMATRRELTSETDAQSVRYDDLNKQLQDLRSRVDRGPAELAQIAHQQAVQQGRQLGTQLVTANPLIAAVLIAAAGVLGHFLK